MKKLFEEKQDEAKKKEPHVPNAQRDPKDKKDSNPLKKPQQKDMTPSHWFPSKDSYVLKALKPSFST